MRSLNITNFPSIGYSVAEAVNTLCTNLSFSGENVRKIMVTSSHASEGKSFVSMNIMRTMAKFGRSVVLVDADLRRSEINRKYGLQFPEGEEKWGLAHYLAGKVGQDEVIYATNMEGAYFVPIGREVSNPLPLLNSQRFQTLMDDLAQRADYVIVDAPPVGTVIDGAQIAKYCDGTLLVVSYNTVRRQELIDLKDQLEQTGCPILGTALNMVEYDSYLSKKYYYKSYYSRDGYYRKGNEKTGKHDKR
ncbi:MAG: CpsD/CapB family tyrosine-protein kinase [Aristaeellaceae bacterium]